jgi:MFS family permease
MFLFGASAVFVAELIAPSLTAFLMARTPWIPLIGGLGVIALGVIPALFISETLHLRPSAKNRTGEVATESDSEGSIHSRKSTNFFSLLKIQATDALKRIRESTSVLHSLPVLLLLVPFITSPFGRQSTDLSLRFISKRFSWKLSQTNLILTLRAVVNLVLLLAILPGTSYYLTERLHFSSKEKDLSLARVSAILPVIGSLLVGLSPNIVLTISGLVIITLGTGFISLVRALITTLVDKEHVGRLYAAIAVVETTTALLAGPTVAGLYSLALKLKGPWIGLPFFGIAAICFIGGLAVWCFGFLKKPQEEMPYGDEDRETLVGETMFLEGDTVDEGFINLI